jgi:type I restriction enzyme, S subunit
VLKLSAVTNGYFRPDKCKTLPSELAPRPYLEVNEGDLLFTRKNTHELVAAVALVRNTPPRLLLPDLIFRLRIAPNVPLLADYLGASLANPNKRQRVQSLASGSAGSMPNISKGRLRTVLTLLPPIALQRRFAEQAADLQAAIAQQERMADASDQLVASLMAQLFDSAAERRAA